MRVGIVALQHESNTFLATPTTLEHFQRDLLLLGDEVRRLESSHHEVGGFFAGLAHERIEAVPVFAARAIPAGPIRREAFNRLVELLNIALDRAGPLDGLLVAPHGAAVSEGLDSADGNWLAGLRRRFGQGFPIIGTLDPHGNLALQMIEATDALISYRTNPHLDQRDRGLEAARLMARTLRGEVRPTQAAAFPPLIINIERQRTDEPHLRAQYDFADAMRRDPRVLSNSLMLGFPYADVPNMGSAVIVVTDKDPALARGLADEWAARLWANRHDFVGKYLDVGSALDFAKRNEGPICLLDMGDNVGGGSPGDGTILAHALHERRLGPAFVCLFDPEAASIADKAGWVKQVHLRVGGKIDDKHGPPIDAVFTVLSTSEGRFEERDTRHGGFQSFDMGLTAILWAESGLCVQATSHRVPPFSLGQLTSCNLNPAAFRVLVAKGVHAPVAAYEPVCKHLLRVNTPGVTTADLSRLEFHKRRQPMFPFEDFDFLGGTP